MREASHALLLPLPHPGRRVVAAISTTQMPHPTADAVPTTAARDPSSTLRCGFRVHLPPSPSVFDPRH
ncbi:hypothetical protein B0H17DRAFT_1110788 [Mycena rosella]|uniref:Uncharacterized protein n=1 Tax=Mycena rosella TaxID=1033263 RepID=A0AAD7FLD0_MYCRO|nr:hypothetical protein B0H17DRAFT_1110788 [Mycena rosella]